VRGPYHADREADEQVLDMLHLRDRGWTHKQIGEKYGMTKSAVIGLLWRINKEMEREGMER